MTKNAKHTRETTAIGTEIRNMNNIHHYQNQDPHAKLINIRTNYLVTNCKLDIVEIRQKKKDGNYGEVGL